MSGPRLNVSRTVRCPCGSHSLKGDRSDLGRHVRSRTRCPTCGRVFVERMGGKASKAAFLFVRAHEVA
jgi:transposase-like protein